MTTPKRCKKQEITELFIEIWMNERSLWDTSCPLYKRREPRSKSFQVFKERLGIEEHDVKSKINTLRSYFMVELKKARADENFVSKWAHYQSMQFLKDSYRKLGDDGDNEASNSGIETIAEQNNDDDNDDNEANNKYSPGSLFNKRKLHGNSKYQRKRYATDHVQEGEEEEEAYEEREATPSPPPPIKQRKTVPGGALAPQERTPDKAYVLINDVKSSNSISNGGSSYVLLNDARNSSHEMNNGHREAATNGQTHNYQQAAVETTPLITGYHAVMHGTATNGQQANTLQHATGTTTATPLATPILPRDPDELFGLSIAQSLKSIPDTSTKEFVKFKMHELIYKAQFGLLDLPS